MINKLPTTRETTIHTCNVPLHGSSRRYTLVCMQVLDMCTRSGQSWQAPLSRQHHTPALNQVAPEPSTSLHHACARSIHASLKRSRSVQSVTFQPGLGNDGNEERQSSIAGVLPGRVGSIRLTGSLRSQSSITERPQGGRSGGTHARCPPPPQDRTQYRYQEGGSSRASTPARSGTDRCASGRHRPNTWLGTAAKVVESAVRAIQGDRSRRETVRMHKQGGTTATISRVVETAVETLLLNWGQFHPVQPPWLSAEVGRVPHDSATGNKPAAVDRAGQKRKAAARRRLLQCMTGARVRIDRMSAEAHGLAVAAAAAARADDRCEAEKLQRAIAKYVKLSGAQKRTVVDLSTSMH